MEPRLPFIVPASIVDEDSDRRITEVKREQRRAAGGQLPQLRGEIADADSELPTEPVKTGDKRPDRRRRGPPQGSGLVREAPPWRSGP